MLLLLQINIDNLFPLLDAASERKELKAEADDRLQTRLAA